MNFLHATILSLHLSIMEGLLLRYQLPVILIVSDGPSNQIALGIYQSYPIADPFQIHYSTFIAIVNTRKFP